MAISFLAAFSVSFWTQDYIPQCWSCQKNIHQRGGSTVQLGNKCTVWIRLGLGSPQIQFVCIPETPRNREIWKCHSFILLLAFLSFPALMSPFLLCGLTQLSLVQQYTRLSSSVAIALSEGLKGEHGLCRYLKLQVSESLNLNWV